MQYNNIEEQEALLKEYKLQRYNACQASKFKRYIEERFNQINSSTTTNNETEERISKIYEEILQKIISFYRIKDKKKFFFLWNSISKDYLENKKP